MRIEGVDYSEICWYACSGIGGMCRVFERKPPFKQSLTSWHEDLRLHRSVQVRNLIRALSWRSKLERSFCRNHEKRRKFCIPIWNYCSTSSYYPLYSKQRKMESYLINTIETLIRFKSFLNHLRNGIIPWLRSVFLPLKQHFGLHVDHVDHVSYLNKGKL